MVIGNLKPALEETFSSLILDAAQGMVFIVQHIENLQRAYFGSFRLLLLGFQPANPIRT